jgi:hypothetical protein
MFHGYLESPKMVGRVTKVLNMNITTNTDNITSHILDVL